MSSVTPPLTRSSLGKSFGVIAVAAVIMLGADVAGSYALVIAGWGRQPVMLVALPAILVVLVFALIGTARLITGRAHVPGSILIALLFGALCAIAISTSRVAPAFFGDNAWVHFALPALCAVAFGLFLGPTTIRILGAAAAAGAMVLISVQPSAADRLAEGGSDAHQEKVAEFLAAGDFPYITEAPGWRNAYVVAGPVESKTWLISDSGSIAVAYVHDGEFVEVAPLTGSLIDFERGSTRASAADIAELTGTLREMTAAEVEQYLAAGLNRAGAWIATPGL